MNWSDERYVRLYVRDTTAWLMWPWQARAVLPLVMRRLDRAGTMELGGYGMAGLGVAIGLPVDVVEPGMAALLKDGCVQINGETLLMPNFLEAQEAKQSDKARQAESRARRRDRAKSPGSVTKRDGLSQNVTECHTASQAVTGGHTASHDVTPSRAVPSCTVPSLAEPNPLSADADPSQPSLFKADAPTPKPATKPRKPADTRHAATIALWCRLFEEHRHSRYEVQGGKDGKAVQRLLSFASATDDEIERRMRRAFAEPWFAEHGDLATFVGCWNKYAAAGETTARPAYRDYEAPKQTFRMLKPGEDLYADPLENEVAP